MVWIAVTTFAALGPGVPLSVVATASLPAACRPDFPAPGESLSIEQFIGPLRAVARVVEASAAAAVIEMADGRRWRLTPARGFDPRLRAGETGDRGWDWVIRAPA